MQVRDLAVDAREGELAAATHGRAFWILDNLALLEQLARQTSYGTANAQLFAPETAWLTQSYGGDASGVPSAGENPRYGARVFFNLPSNYDGRTPATLSFLDANGATVRRFTLHAAPKKNVKLTEDQEDVTDQAHLRSRSEAEATGAKPGMNAFQWNLEYTPAFDAPGYKNDVTDDFPDAADGPTALPGSYTVVLQYGSTTLQAPLTIALDPRVHPAPGDLEARLALEQQILGTIDGLDRAIAAAMTASAHMPPGKRAQVDAEIANLVLLDKSSSEYDVVHPSKIREQLGFLLNSLENAYAKPTPAELSTYQDLKTLAQQGISNLQSLTTGSQ